MEPFGHGVALEQCPVLAEIRRFKSSRNRRRRGSSATTSTGAKITYSTPAFG